MSDSSASPRVYRLISAAAWRAVCDAAPDDEGVAAVVPWSETDRRDGFLHLSARDQVAETARKHYAGVDDLWVLEIDAAALGDALRWEVSRGGALFPHVYGEAPRAAVVDARPYEEDAFA